MADAPHGPLIFGLPDEPPPPPPPGTVIQAIDIAPLSGVQGAWNLEGDLLDRGPHGLDLVQAGSGFLMFPTEEGKTGVYVYRDIRLERAANDPELTITNALTVHVLCKMWGKDALASQFLFSFHAPGSGTGVNALYSSSGDGTVTAQRWFTQGPPDTSIIVAPSPPSTWTLHTFTRGSGATPNIKYYCNGLLVSSQVGSQATDGSASRLGVGCLAGITASEWPGLYGDFVVQDVEMAAAPILAVAEQVGVA